MNDYRTSHASLRKGAEYHAKFSTNPYRAMMWEFERRLLSSIVRRLAPPCARYLDFACGTGRVISHVAPAVASSTGVDVSEGMLAIARAELPNCRFVCGDLTRSNELKDEKFDMITAFRFFANAEDDLRRDAILSLAERLAPCGYLVFNNHKNASSIVYAFAALIRRRQRNMSHREVLELVEHAGLRIVESHHIGVFPANDKVRTLPIWILKSIESAAMKIPVFGTIASNRIYVCALKNQA